jgi:hypothetical protein
MNKDIASAYPRPAQAVARLNDLRRQLNLPKLTASGDDQRFFCAGSNDEELVLIDTVWAEIRVLEKKVPVATETKPKVSATVVPVQTPKVLVQGPTPVVPGTRSVVPQVQVMRRNYVATTESKPNTDLIEGKRPPGLYGLQRALAAIAKK